MSKSEKAVWKFLDDKEKRKYWKYFIVSLLGWLLLLCSAVWVGFFNPESVQATRRLASLAGFAGLILWWSYAGWGRLLLERMLKMKGKLDFWEGGKRGEDKE